MAVCPKCSRENPENAVFCEACGSLMSGAYADTAPVEPAAVTRIRKIGGSGAMLFLAILQTLTMVFSIPKVTAYSTYGGMQLRFGFNFPLAAILTFVAFWMLYYTCKKPAGQLLSTGGITILRVLQMLSMILYALAFVIVLAVLGVLMVAGSFYYYSSDVYIPIYLAGAFLSIVVVGLLLAFLHRLFAYRFLGSVKQTATSGFSACRSAAPLAVFSILSGLISLASSVLTFIFSEEINALLSQFVYAVEDLLAESGQDIIFNSRLTDQITVGGLTSLLAVAAGLCGAIGAILIGVLAVRYRAAMWKAD